MHQVRRMMTLELQEVRIEIQLNTVLQNHLHLRQNHLLLRKLVSHFFDMLDLENVFIIDIEIVRLYLSPFSS